MAKYFLALLGSRLGLRFAPIGSHELNIGVENGPATIEAKIFKNLPAAQQTFSPNFPPPEKLPPEEYLQQLFTIYNQAQQQLIDRWSDTEMLITLGGDHSISYISLKAVIDKFGEQNIGVIMFDSHADLHLPSTSPTNNFHGMWLRTFFTPFMENNDNPALLQPNQLAYVGNLQIEDEEQKFIGKHQIKVYSDQSVSSQAAKELFDWAQKFTHLHISFDIDIFEEKLSPATGTPNPNGFSKAEVLTMLSPLFNHPSLSLDMVEFNPQKKGSKLSINLIKQILKLIF